jgi:hypothetical protein
MHVNEILPRRGSSVPQQQVLHIRQLQRPLQQRVGVEINLADRQKVGGTSITIHLVEEFRIQSSCIHGLIPFGQCAVIVSA